MAKLKATMFREYDIRGRVSEEELNAKSVEIIARGYGTMLRNRGIGKSVIGHDYRDCSEEFKEAFIRGITSTGIDLGMVLTPMLYSAQYYYRCEGGAMITASHNPKGWSGFKLALGYSHTLTPKEIEELYSIITKENFASGEGEVKKESYFEAYTKDLLSRVRIYRKLKAVVNTGNGTPGAFLPEILRRAGCEVIELNTELNWDFPKYYPNPSKVEMMEETASFTVENNADIGMAFDGDGDRLGVCDDKGRMVWADRWLILLSRLVLQELPGAKIIFDVKCSQALEDEIVKHGGKPIMWKTGHSYIKAKLHEENAPLAGEMSGHVFFGKPYYYGFDDACFAALKLLEYLSSQEKTFSELIDSTPYYVSTPTLHAHCPDEVKYDVISKIAQEFKREGYEVIDINGARVKFKDGWGLVRASSNLPVLVLRFEAKSKERLKEIMDIFKEKLSKFPEVSQDWESG